MVSRIRTTRSRSPVFRRRPPLIPSPAPPPPRSSTATSVNANNSSSWYATGTPVTQYRVPYATTYNSLLLGNNLLRGSDNTFANTPAGTSAGNVERLDFILSGSGIAATAAMAFAIFDRGLAGLTAHDGVKVALITLMGTPTPTPRPTMAENSLPSHRHVTAQPIRWQISATIFSAQPMATTYTSVS